MYLSASLSIFFIFLFCCVVTPTIVGPPKDTSAQEGTTASFTCSAVGIPLPTIQWFMGTQLVGEGRVFSISDVDSTKAGTYTCVAKNNAGNTASSSRLIVFGKRVTYSVIATYSGTQPCEITGSSSASQLICP